MRKLALYLSLTNSHGRSQAGVEWRDRYIRLRGGVTHWGMELQKQIDERHHHGLIQKGKGTEKMTGGAGGGE
jgi:hypothetical protein